MIQSEYDHLNQGYFNSAYFGPSPKSAKNLVLDALEKEVDPRDCLSYDKFFFELPDQIRSKIAHLLNCNADNISLNTSSTDSISMIAHNIEMREGDKVVSFKGEFPSNVIPWMVAAENRNLDFELLDHFLPTAEWLAEHLPAKTKIVNISHVAFDTGRKIDLEGIGKFLKERDIIFIVDATQSLGGLAISKEELQYIDILVCSTYKWMLGPYGGGFSYFTDEALAKIKRPTGNWITSPNSKGGKSLSNYTTKALEGARKFDRGQSPNMLFNACLSAALDFLRKIGLEEIGKHNKAMSDYFLEIMPKRKFEIKTPLDSRGNILSIFSSSIDADNLNKNLKENKIEAGIREGNIRLSFHLFNTKKQVDSLVKVLEQNV